MLILLIDTSRPQAAVVLAGDGKVLANAYLEADRTLGKNLLKGVEEVLMKADKTLENVDRVAAHEGPGGYSALRLGVVTAMALAQALGKELVAVSGGSAEENIKQAEARRAVGAIALKY